MCVCVTFMYKCVKVDNVPISGYTFIHYRQKVIVKFRILRIHPGSVADPDHLRLPDPFNQPKVIEK